MGIIKRQGIQNSIISYAGVVLGYFNLIVLFPKVLTVDQVGLTRILPNVALILAQLSALGFANAGIKYFPFFRNKTQGHHNFLLLFLGVPLGGFLLITTLYFLFKPALLGYLGKDEKLLIAYNYYIIPLSFFTLFYNLFTAYLTSLYKTVIPSFTKDFLLRLGTTVCILLYYFNLVSFETFLFLFIGVNCAITLVLLVYIVWLKQFHLSFAQAPLGDKPIRPMIQYGLYAFMGNISSIIITIIDQFMISHYQNLGSVGVYSTCINVASVILIMGSSILKIALPQIADYWKNSDMEGMQKLYKQVTRLNMVMGCLLFIGIWANIHNLFAFLPPEYAAGKYVILFVCAARLFDLATGINGAILLTSSHYRYDLFFNILLSVLTILANNYFIPQYGITGAGFVFFGVYTLINTLRVISVWIFYKIQPFNRTSVYIIFLAGLAYVIGSLVPIYKNPFLDLTLRSVLIAVLYGTGILALNLAPELTAKYTGFLKNKLF